MFGFVPENELYWANEVRIYAMAAAAIAALVTLGAGYAQVRLQSEVSARKEAVARVIQQASDERIAQAQSEGARAIERAEGLALEAAQAKLEQERLKAQLAWRVLPPGAVQIIHQRAATNPSAINIEYPTSDTEAAYLAIQIANIFVAAGWQIGMNAVTIHGTIIFGLVIPNSDMPASASAQDAFRSAGIGFSTDAVPPAGMGFGNTLPNAPRLLVGSKPIPSQ